MNKSSEYAVIAKVKVLYSKRIRTKDLKQLLNKANVPEIASYLKQETYFSGVLKESNVQMIHRGQLENMINRHRIDIYRRLLKYTFNDNFFAKHYAKRLEINQLLVAIRMLNADKMDRFIANFPVYLNKYMSFDLFSLARIKNYDDLLNVVKDSEYYKLLGPMRPISKNINVDVLSCETALLTNYFKKSLKHIDMNYDGSDADKIRTLLYMNIDLFNVMLTYRMKHFAKASTQEILEHIINIKTYMSKELINSIANAHDENEVFNILHNVRSLRYYLNTNSAQGLEHSIFLFKKKISNKAFRYSNRSLIVLLSYMSLLEIEGYNLINIIEGVRYSLPPKEIEKLLILA